MKNSSLKDTLIATFAELIKEGWIEPVEKVYSDQITWYLPFFVTKQGKPRVVYDDAATVGGVCLNQAVLAGTNLLNNLVEVVVRFRLGKYACVADFCAGASFKWLYPKHSEICYVLSGLEIVIWKEESHKCLDFQDMCGNKFESLRCSSCY